MPIFIGAVMRSIRAAEETGFYLHDVYGPTKEIMLCHLEPLPPPIILVIALLGGFSGLRGRSDHGTGYYTAAADSASYSLSC